MPVASRSSSNPKMLYLMIGAVGLLAVVAIIMVVLLLKGDDKKPAQVASNTPTEEKGDKDSDSDKDKSADADKDADKDKDKASADGEKKEPAVAGGETAKEPEKTPEKQPEKSGGTTAPKTTHTTAPKSGGTTTAAKSTTTAKAEPKAEAPASGGCEEVSCVLNNYEGSCCAKYKKKTSGGGGGGGGGGAAKSDLPDSLDRAMISTGIGNVKARVSTCGDKSPAKGKVKVKVSVGGDGRVSNVAVETTPDPALGACVSAAVSKATFAKTQSGGSFSYPFVF
jgi:outer membrane biosynthesis protein TonB